MTSRLSELLELAAGAGAALGAFTCYDLDTAEAVLAGAANRRSPVVLLVSAGSVGPPGGPALLAGLSEMAGASKVPACVQLDHLRALSSAQAEQWRRAGAFMVDGSALDFAANVDVTRAAVAAATAVGAEVEGELGRLKGDEDVASGDGPTTFTGPVQALDFVRSTGVCCLAVSVGNRHGPYPRSPDIQWSLLEELHRQVPVPLALHGASGLDESELGRAVSLGARKVNFNADLRSAYFGAIASGVGTFTPTLDLLALKKHVVGAVQEVVEEKLRRLGWVHSGQPL